jgi:hypothetical protein
MGPDGNLQLNTPRHGKVRAIRAVPERAALMALWGALGIVVLFSPIKLCLTAVILHVPCPGCGMTRATLALLRGDFAQATAVHPLAPLVAPIAVAFFGMQATAYVRTGRAFGTGSVPRMLELVGAILVILLVAVWLARFFGYFGGPVSLR